MVGVRAAGVNAADRRGAVGHGPATGGDLGPRPELLLATGFCGALSTWSTFSYEVLTLASARRLAVAGGYLAVSVVIGTALSFAGVGIASALW